MKWLLWLIGAAYALCPYDLLPDFFPGAGWLDDLLLLGAIWWYYSSLRKRSGWQRRARQAAGGFGAAGNAGKEPGGQKETGFGEETRRSPYDILGVRRDAAPEEIRSAYRKLAAQYHPDKVSHLGQEFQTLAERRFKEIQEAYEALRVSGPEQPPRR